MTLASPPTKILGGTRPLRPIGIDAHATKQLSLLLLFAGIMNYQNRLPYVPVSIKAASCLGLYLMYLLMPILLLILSEQTLAVKFMVSSWVVSSMLIILFCYPLL